MRTVDVALEAGADMIGVVFFEKSPRHVSLATACALPDEPAAGRALSRSPSIRPTPSSRDIMASLKPDLLQLHGAETPERVADIRSRFNVRVMKAIGVAEAADLAPVRAFAAVSDLILVDSKPPKTAEALPGGKRADIRLAIGGRP